MSAAFEPCSPLE